MAERLMLPVQIAQIIFRALWQAEYRIEINNLYMLQLIKTETEALQREIEEEKRHEPQIKLANAVGETAGSGTDELAGDAENMQPDRNKGVVIIVGDDEDDGSQPLQWSAPWKNPR